jgi:hypothetical protein
MSQGQRQQTLADYVAIAICPLLIMALVGSLVFFLLEVLYVGEYDGRLRWILFFFVFGAVLIARISMRGDIADRAGLYGLVLGFLVWLGLLIYIEYPRDSPAASFGWAINLFLIAITWWCAHRLTWDCTLIDDSVDASGAGLLEVAGLEQNKDREQVEAPADSEQQKKGKKSRKNETGGFIGWWERYRQQRDQRPHAPGVWIVYFSLAALPLFGLGHAIISASSPDSEKMAARHAYVFWLMVIYVGSGLGLLLTTSFLGLRRYLRQRGLKMPVTMTGVWLTAGGILAAVLLILGAWLPRPHADSPLLRELGKTLSELTTSEERDASQFAQKGDGAGKDKGQPGEKGEKDGDGAGKDAKGEKGEKSDAKDGQNKDNKGSGGQDKSPKDAKQGGSKDSKQGKDGKAQAGKQEKDSKAQDKSANNTDKKDAQAKKKEERKSGGGGKAASQSKGDKRQEEEKEKDRRSRDASSSKSTSFKFLPEWSRDLGNVLKWVVGILIALVVLFLLLRSGLKFLANFTNWARRLLNALQALWRDLLSLFRGRAKTGAEQAAAAKAKKPRPFASFQDPFAWGTAEEMPLAELVRYSFEAMQAWAAEHDLERQAGETPLEFVERIGQETPALEHDAQRLAGLYVRLAYARGTLNRSCLDSLRRFWQRLLEVEEKPLSAGVGS